MMIINTNDGVIIITSIYIVIMCSVYCLFSSSSLLIQHTVYYLQNA
jgi:hypothetical protein